MVSATLRNSFTSIGEVDPSLPPSSLVLKLALTEGALRYFVFSETHSQIVFYGSYILHHIDSTEELKRRITKICEDDDVLQLPFSQKLIGFDTSYSLLPTQLAFMNQVDGLSQSCEALGIDLIFEKDQDILDAFIRLFKHPQFVHLNSTFLHLLPEFYNDVKERLYLNITSTYFDIIHFSRDKRLKMMNRYRFKTETDLIYFVMLYCDEIKLDREKIELILLGEIDPKSKTYDICARYFRHINFISNPPNIGFTKAFDQFHRHLHFNLYNLAI